MQPGTGLDISALGVEVHVRKTAAQTGGELVEFDVVGEPRGLIAAAHVHTTQTERHEVLEGAMRLTLSRATRVLRAGEAMAVPPGVAHRQRGAGAGSGCMRVQLRPAGRTEAFLERLAELSAAGAYNRWGFPRPLAGAALVRDFADEGHAAQAPLAVQRALAGALLGVGAPEYRFVDEWDVAAPREEVFAAIADARTYPQWWRPVYIDVEADGEPAVGKVSRQHFKGRLPYHLHTRSEIVRLEPPEIVEGDVDGDLRGRGTWTLTEREGATHVRFDWRVVADRPLLRALSPLLRPALRWNHNWAIARARDGLEPYALATFADKRSSSRARTAGHSSPTTL